MEPRKDQLKKFSDFIDDANRQIDQLLSIFGWKKAELVQLKRPNQTKNKPAVPDPDAFPESFYDDHYSFSVKVDKHVQANVLHEVHSRLALNLDMPVEREIPATHEDLLVNFSPEERLALDHYVLRNTPAIEPLEEIKISFKKQNKDAKMTSLADIATYRRNVFRRNQKYRVAKNPLTYQEEVRNLIQMQTESMAEYLGQVKTREKSSREEEEEADREKRKRHKHKRDREGSSREKAKGKGYEESHRKRSKYD